MFAFVVAVTGERERERDGKKKWDEEKRRLVLYCCI
jgi:hypothetical protein